MKQAVVGALLGVALLSLVSVVAEAEELTVQTFMAAQKSGASIEGVIAMVNNPDNTVAVTAGDITTLRDAGVPEPVISAIFSRITMQPPAPVPLQPDDPRLANVVRLIKSGMSESIINEQVRQSGQNYNLTVNDLLYLKQSGAQESTLAALMATRSVAPAEPVQAASPPVAPPEMVFDDLVLVKPLLKFNRVGRLVMRGNTFAWEDRDDPLENFRFETTGLEKVWYTCEPRTPENFCYQINFKIVKGDRYQFRDGHRESGSSAAVTKIMEALRTYFPRLAYGAPDS